MPLIRAAGGLVWRTGADGQPEVCLVHRERYHDWALPKGKLERGEHPLAAAVREVAEETSIRARPQLPLARVRYQVGGAPKVVDYWAMAATEVPEFRPGSEVDALRWLPASAAAEQLTYPQDADLVRRWQQLPPVTSTVLFMRHALAGARDSWHGPDNARPLSPAGRADAERLCQLLAYFRPDALVSASPHRCVQTLAPLARSTGQTIVVMERFDEDADDPDGAATTLRELAVSATCTVVSSQGGVIGPVLARLLEDPRLVTSATAKGAGWLIPFAGAAPLAPARLAPRNRPTARLR